MAYQGYAANYGRHNDPMVGGRNLVYDITPQPRQMPDVSPSGRGHPACSAAATAIAATLPPAE